MNGFPMMMMKCEKGHEWNLGIAPWWFDLRIVKCPKCEGVAVSAKWGGFSKEKTDERHDSGCGCSECLGGDPAADTAYKKACERLDKMTDGEVNQTYDALVKSIEDGQQTWQDRFDVGMTLSDWGQLVYSERSKRKSKQRIDDGDLVKALVFSRRFQQLSAQCSMRKMTENPAIDFSGLSDEETEAVLNWANGGLPSETPKVIADYIEECKDE